MARPGVLMVTGAYYPEVSGGGLQCREIVRALGDSVEVIVLTTSTDPSLPAVGKVDGVPVHRVPVDVDRWISALTAAARLVAAFVGLRSRFQIVHLHGFSRKSMLVILLARLSGKKVILKLSSAGYDDPLAVRAKGSVRFWCYSRADLFVGVSPALGELYDSSGLPRERFRLIPNGINLGRFRPGDPRERQALRRELELPDDLALILFVGFFSREKHPDLLFQAWARLQGQEVPPTGLVFVGATRSRYYEIDRSMARRMRTEAQRLGVEKHLVFVEVTHEIEKYYRAADMFVLPSSREGFSNALLEAMATGLPCVASKLDGVTDGLIDHGVNGLLVPSGDVAALQGALRSLLQDPAGAQALGKKARETVRERYSITQTASRVLEAYRTLADLPGPVK